MSAAGEARTSDEVERDTGPSGGDTAPGPGAAGVAGAEGGPGAVALEGGSAEEDSDIGPAEEEGEGEGEEGLDVAVDAHQFPMAGFRIMFLDLVHSLLHRIYYNDHILIRPRGGRVTVHPRPRSPGSMALELQGPERPEEGPAEAEATEEAEEEASAWEAAEEELAEEAQDTASVWQLAMAAPDPDGERRVKGQKRSPHHRWRPLPPTVSGRRSLWELKATGAQGEPSPLRAFTGSGEPAALCQPRQGSEIIRATHEPTGQCQWRWVFGRELGRKRRKRNPCWVRGLKKISGVLELTPKHEELCGSPW